MQLNPLPNYVRHLMSLPSASAFSLRSSHAAGQLKCQKYIMNTEQTRAGKGSRSPLVYESPTQTSSYRFTIFNCP